MTDCYAYTYSGTKTHQPPFEEIIDYDLKVPCQNRPEVLDYIYRLYRYGSWLYITDIFPRMFAEDNRCFQRFTSREGYTVSMRRLSVSCLLIFVRHFVTRDMHSVMVISGSREPGEAPEGPSRKLRLYRHFFQPLLQELQLRAVDMSAQNAFLLTSRDNNLTDDELRQKYIDFKKTQNRT